MNDVVELITPVENIDEYGNVTTASEIKKQVFIEEKGVKMNESYQAAAQGLKADKMFVMRAVDYDEQLLLDHNNKRYRIIRTYLKNTDFIEIICQRDVN